MKTRIVLIFSVFLFVVLIGGCASFEKTGEPPEDSFIPGYGGDWDSGYSEDSGLNYIITYPGDYDPDGEKWPVIIFLHSLQERGDILEYLFFHAEGEGSGLAAVALQTPGFPFVTVSPLCPDGTGWPLITGRLNTLIEELVRTRAVDPDRIYITGVSMGGMGVWAYAMDYPQVPAAVAPISGGIYPPLMRYDYSALTELPVWAFHDLFDKSIPLKDEIDIITGLKERGGDIRYSITSEEKHYIHEEIYRDGALFRWFLNNKRGE